MKGKVVLDEASICEEYVNTQIGVESLASKYHVGKKRVKEILSKNGIEIKKRGGQCEKGVGVVADWCENRYPSVIGKHYIAVDRESGFETKDYENKAGVLTTYIKNMYGIEVPSLHHRKKFFASNGIYWWEQWFDIKLVDDKQVKKCPYCGWETIDVENKSGVFEVHLLKNHNITKVKYLEEFPSDREYFVAVSESVNRQIDTNKENFVTCKICDKKLARIDNHHLKIHGITKAEYVRKFGGSELSSAIYHKKQSTASVIVNTNMTFTKNSKAEKEIKEFIESKGYSCTCNRKILNGREIDIFIPSKNIGIEYNGNKWHTEWFGRKNRLYHLSKMMECKSKGVQLISIFEDEYMLRKDIVLSKISHILGIKDNDTPKIFARKCEVREIYHFEANEFLEKNHIQGGVRSSVHLGAFYNDKLIGVMSFHTQGLDNWELTRFATDNNYICCGVGGKLFNHFIRSYEFSEIKSFADRRWTLNESDNIYTKLGFEFVEFTPPNYTYYNASVDRYKRFHKFNMRKGRLIKKHPELTPNMTESEMVKALGYDRIWDCGLIKYVYKKPTCN